MQYKIDLFAIFIFLGIVQAIFLCFFFFSKPHRQIQSNVFYGILLLSMALCILEIFLQYTGYIIHCLYLVDFSEPLSFLIGPSFYLMVLSMTRGPVPKKQYWHFAFAAIYFVLIIPFFLAPEDVKYNSWVDSFNLDLPYRDYDYKNSDPRIFLITEYHTELTLLSVVFYSILSLAEVIRAFKTKKQSFFKPSNHVLLNLRNGTIQIGLTTVLVLVIKFLMRNDTGDHIFSAFIGMGIYLTSFRVIRESGFFQQPALTEPLKYKSSVLSDDQQQAILNRLLQVMNDQKPFLKPDFSLPDLAQLVGTSVHTLSQAINSGLEKSFFEMTAEFRVGEAKRLLIEQKNVKVEEIAGQVGYNSKSSFNTAFKKLTGMTPSEFRATA